jgi:hypothetical protein
MITPEVADRVVALTIEDGSISNLRLSQIIREENGVLVRPEDLRRCGYRRTPGSVGADSNGNNQLAPAWFEIVREARGEKFHPALSASRRSAPSGYRPYREHVVPRKIVPSW